MAGVEARAAGVEACTCSEGCWYGAGVGGESITNSRGAVVVRGSVRSKQGSSGWTEEEGCVIDGRYGRSA